MLIINMLHTSPNLTETQDRALSTPYFDAPARFRRLAESPEGLAMWAVLNERESVIRMMAASDLDRPAVEVVDGALTERFGALVARAGTASWPWRQMTGAMIKQIMLANGYDMTRSKPVRDGRSFKNGMCYRRRSDKR